MQYDQDHPIAKAVEPQRLHAMAAAEKYARDLISRVFKKFAVASWDLAVVAPLPNWSDPDYRKKKADRDGYLRIVKHLPGSRSPKDPEIVQMRDDEELEAFVESARKNASDQYDAFIVKLIGKCGEVADAQCEGSHVWGYSVLTVTDGQGKSTKWRTKSIINRSKLGLIFNQFPTRKIN